MKPCRLLKRDWKDYLTAWKQLDKITPSEKSSVDLDRLEKSFFEAMDDDFNSPVAISHLFDGIKTINNAVAGKESMTGDDLEKCRQFYHMAVRDILGLVPEGRDPG